MFVAHAWICAQRGGYLGGEFTHLTRYYKCQLLLVSKMKGGNHAITICRFKRDAVWDPPGYLPLLRMGLIACRVVRLVKLTTGLHSGLGLGLGPGSGNLRRRPESECRLSCVIILRV